MTSANKSFEKNIFHRVENVIKQLVHTLAVRSSRYEVRGKFGGHERCIRVARGVARGGEQLKLLLQSKQNVYLFFSMSLRRQSLILEEHGGNLKSVVTTIGINKKTYK